MLLLTYVSLIELFFTYTSIYTPVSTNPVLAQSLHFSIMFLSSCSFTESFYIFLILMICLCIYHKYFCPAYMLPFNFVNDVFSYTEVFNFYILQCMNFFFQVCTFCILLISFSQPQGHNDIFYQAVKLLWISICFPFLKTLKF